MTDTPDPGLFLIVEFDWPAEVTREVARQARALHDLVESADWIRETVAASGGIGGDLTSIWVFWLPDYLAVERLLNDPEDPGAQAYAACFGAMAAVQTRLRHGVAFL